MFLQDECVLVCIFVSCVVNCMWDEWIIGHCSVTCGDGTRTNSRIPKVVAQFGGDECDGTSSSTEKCKDRECPGRTYQKLLSNENCVFMILHSIK